MIYNSQHTLTTIPRNKRLLFLAGSIDLYLEGDWRSEVSKELDNHFNCFDPTNLSHNTLDEPGWKKHIEWELAAMEMADFILLNFLPGAKSPISLVELGLNTIGEKLVVSCPKEFYQSQYVNVLCAYYSVPVFEEVGLAIDYVRGRFGVH